MIKGPEHTAIASPAPARLADWYVGNLEFAVVSVGEGKYMLRAANGYMLEIIPSQGDRPCHNLTSPGFRHMALAVEDMDAAYAGLTAAGVRFESEPFFSGGNRVAFFTDPEGNYLHLITRPST